MNDLPSSSTPVEGNVFLNPVPNGLRPRSFYSVDRIALYREMGFRTKVGFGDPKLPDTKNWRSWIKEHFAQSKNSLDSSGLASSLKWVNSKGWIYNNDPTTWDNNSVDFGPLNLYNCHPELINDKQFDALREMLKGLTIKLYGADSRRVTYIKPIPDFTLERTWIGRLNVKLMPPYVPSSRNPTNGLLTRPELRTSIQKGHSFQRVLVRCPYCESWQYFGRLNQHMYPTFSSTERSKVCRIGEAEIHAKRDA